MKLFTKIVIEVALALLLAWWLIGPDWRGLALNPPLDRSVLSWTTDQRDAAFRLMDRVPFLSKSKPIPSAESTATLEDGAPLTVSIDLDDIFEKARIAGLVVVHKGKIRLERYGLGFTADGRWTSFSVAKSFTSTLVGAAIKDGHIKSIDDKVSDYITGLKGSAYDDVTIEQLLTMSSGVAWNEDYEDPNSDVAQFNLYKAEDGLSNLVSYMRKLERAHPAGEVWHYSTGETNMIGILVSSATGKPISQYLTEKIWQPYGMEQDASWLLNEDGSEIAGCCIQAATRDFAKMGQFILEGAVIGDQSIVPDWWMEKATMRQKDYGVAGQGYGYQWWTQDTGAYAARGIYGQGIYIDPSRDLVIALNSNWTTASGFKDGEWAIREALYQGISAAIDVDLQAQTER